MTAGERRSRLPVPRAVAALGILLVLALVQDPVRAAPPTVSVGPGSVKVNIVSASVADSIEALARAAGFQVRFDNARPSALLFNLDFEEPTVPQALLRLLDGQNLNYGLSLDASGLRVNSLLIFGLASRAVTTSSSPTPTPRAFSTPRIPRGAPISDDVAQDDPEPVAEPEPTPAPVPTPPGVRPGMPYPPLARPPFGTPFGPRPTPSVSPSP